MNQSIDAAAFKWLSANVTELTVAVARAAAVLAAGAQSTTGEREDDARSV
jgi:hypothetical protein